MPQDVKLPSWLTNVRSKDPNARFWTGRGVFAEATLKWRKRTLRAQTPPDPNNSGNSCRSGAGSPEPCSGDSQQSSVRSRQNR